MIVTPPAAVTIIVPGFDVGVFAAEALESLRAQTFTEWVAVLVDDASTDDTGVIFEAFATADPRFRVVHHDVRKGLGAARNTGLRLVETEFVGFLDADDVMRPAALERMVDTLRDTGSELAVGAYVRLRPEASGEYVAGAVQPWVAAATDPERRGVTLAEHPAASGNIVAWSKISRFALWHRLGLSFPEGAAYEDQEIAQRLYTGAAAFDVIPDVVVEWRERADGTSITQHKGELSVLRDYLHALRAGIAVLDAAGAVAALEQRIPLILTLDLPPLVSLGENHPEAAYRAELGRFARELAPRTGAPPEGPLARALDW